MEFCPLAWKAAMRIEPGTAFLANAFRVVCLEREEAMLLLKWEVVVVEKVRFDAAARHVCRRIAGGTIEAMMGI